MGDDGHRIPIHFTFASAVAWLAILSFVCPRADAAGHHHGEQGAHSPAPLPSHHHGQQGAHSPAPAPSQHHGQQSSHSTGHSAAHSTQDPNYITTVLLYGSLASAAGFYYLTTLCGKSIEMETWKLLSMNVSIFVAVLIWADYQHVLAVFKQTYKEPGFVVMFVFLYLFETLLFPCCCLSSIFCCSEVKWSTVRAFITISAHVVGFASLNLLGWFQNYLADTLGTSQALCGLIGAVGGGFTIYIIFELWELIVKRIFASKISEFDSVISPTEACSDSEEEEEKVDDEFQETLDEFQNDALALATGFAMMRTVVALISGSLPKILQAGVSHTTRQKTIFLIDTILVTLAAAAYTVLKDMQCFAAGVPGQLRNFFGLFLNMLSAWMWLQLIRWVVYQSSYGSSHSLFVHVLMSVLINFVGMIIVTWYAVVRRAVSSYAPRKFFHDLTKIVALGMGLSWELTFDISVEGLFHESHSKTGKVLGVIAVKTVLIIIVLPAFVWSIYPRAMQAEEFEEKEEEMLELQEALSDARQDEDLSET